ncbi:MAG TPA: hypothetical protein VJT49_25145 [Amycolatopsis sp.]|uniref:hypothetical protein n=1 Tax=Amycolatopsis sp. TaxID=37632 RepID=UPI002B4A3B09|nr:hypothetical protein [Amycolatopsis sp.]HKS48336.1 hypothetical protein [Amycolatopsis sp.]
MISGRGRDRVAATGTARLAGWPKPDSVRVVVVDGPAHTRFAGPGPPRVLVSDPVGREWTETAAGGSSWGRSSC